MVKMKSLSDDYSIKYSDRELIGRFWKYLTAYKWQLTIIILTILATAGVSIVPPLMVERAFNILALVVDWLSVAQKA